MASHTIGYALAAAITSPGPRSSGSSSRSSCHHVPIFSLMPSTSPLSVLVLDRAAVARVTHGVHPCREGAREVVIPTELCGEGSGVLPC